MAKKQPAYSYRIWIPHKDGTHIVDGVAYKFWEEMTPEERQARRKLNDERMFEKFQEQFGLRPEMYIRFAQSVSS